ncbi:MAG: hypothetical protein H0X25_10875 [Acidobacteriales bacterium]|nr:hypothetical protein [Terriglobales bacterium]
MHDHVTFSSFDPLFCEAPQQCEMCREEPPIFMFDSKIVEKRQNVADENGFCCGNCATRLLRKLARSESRQWLEEEAAIKKEDLDTTQIHQRIVNSF